MHTNLLTEQKSKQYYAIARTLRPVAAGIKRKTVREYPDRLSAARYVNKDTVELWVCNSSRRERRVKVVIEAHDLRTGQKICLPDLDEDMLSCTLKANGTTEITELVVPKVMDSSSGTCVSLCIFDRDEGGQEPLATSVSWPEP